MPRRSTRSKALRSGKKKTIRITLDEVPVKEKQERAGAMSAYLARYVLIAFLLHMVTLGTTFAEFVYAPFWTLYFRGIVILRALLLAAVYLYASCCGVLPVVNMFGSGLGGRETRDMKPVPSLALWYILGHVDFYLARVLPLVAGPFAVLIDPEEQTVHMALVRFGVDFALLGIFYFSYWIIYRQGVRLNVIGHLLVVREDAYSREI